MIIYCVTNLITGKQYIGQTTKSLKERKRGHIKFSKRQTHTYFQNALIKYGKENFVWETLEECKTVEELNEKEQHYINLLKTLSPDGYNLTTGGKNHNFSEETKAKISETTKKRWVDPEERKRNREAAIRQWADPKLRKNLSITIKKMFQNNPELRRKSSEGAKKRWQKPEVRKRYDAAMQDPEVRKKKSEAQKKRWADPEERKRISEAQKIGWAKKKASMVLRDSMPVLYSGGEGSTPSGSSNLSENNV